MRFTLVWMSLSLACASSGGSPSLSKEEAREVRGGADLGVDYCAENGWYGDAECDDFCPSPDPDCGVTSFDGEGPTLCVALRGNGTHIPGHFGSLARILETYGLLDATAGGSSGSITSFLLESVQMNPHVRCAECDAAQAGRRAALLIKSIDAYFEVLAATDEATAIQSLVRVAQSVDAAGIADLLERDPLEGVAALDSVLSSEELRALVNPEVLELLRTSPDPVFHARDLLSALRSAGSFTADSALILVRPGVVSFEAVADRIGRVGSFYAGYEPTDGVRVRRFLDECADAAVGLDWAEVAAVDLGDTTCGELLRGAIEDFRAAVSGGSFASRVDDAVGGTLPALISTSVLEGDAVAAWRAARESYLAGEVPELVIDFDDVRFGYWGREEDLARVDANSRGFDDAKTAKRRLLGPATWREVLALSPAEPGLARALELPRSTVVGAQISAGGWSDLAPTLVLRNLGCQEVIYVTRRGPESRFARGVATLLGMQSNADSALYDLARGDSAFTRSLEAADAVWCTDWDSLPASAPAAIWSDGYEAPMESLDPYFLEGAYENVVTALGVAGCTPGIAP